MKGWGIEGVGKGLGTVGEGVEKGWGSGGEGVEEESGRLERCILNIKCRKLTM